MALLPSELVRLRYELGYNLLTVGAEPWIGVASAFDNVIGPYLRSGASTTSSTAVVAASAPTPTPITLADATGFDVGARVVVDVDARQEIVTVQSISGLIITVVLKNAHTGSYPVTVEGGESIVRDILTKLRNVSDKLESASTKAGIKRVDEIELYPEGTSGVFQTLRRQREYWRDELASAVGLARMNRTSGGGSRMSVY
jgi:hypothetical protein